jgi:hypothetical protein
MKNPAPHGTRWPGWKYNSQQRRHPTPPRPIPSSSLCPVGNRLVRQRGLRGGTYGPAGPCRHLSAKEVRAVEDQLRAAGRMPAARAVPASRHKPVFGSSAYVGQRVGSKS